MALDYQIVVDCAEPLTLSRFWAAAMGYEPEDNGALIEHVLAQGLAGEDDYTVVDGRKAWRTLAVIRHPEDPVHEFTGAGLGRRILFQQVPEPKTVKNRMHLDLRTAPGERDAEVARLEGLGAVSVAVVEEPGASHVRMRDPEGNEFDVQ
ncbi:MAG TPA: hypothetical protein K8V84_23890 [Nocardiopsis listeri]|uniref:VOC family protein n=1 Tax=Nocardiopsis listeri TaxID=53440 RepID=UPI001DD36363|nr:VOC family protein [Nocardiopsis listeri]HJE61522.1 hypothetical protein [Nocardiopsis listeri]